MLFKKFLSCLGIALFLLSGAMGQELRWQVPVGEARHLLVNTEGTLYTLSSEGSLVAIDSQGNLKWTVSVGGTLASRPFLRKDGVIVLLLGDGSIVGIDAQGKQVFSYSVPGVVQPGNLVVGPEGNFYLRTAEAEIVALNPNGSKAWTYTTPDRITGGPVVGPDGTLYVASAEGNLWALTPQGKEKWNYPRLGGPASDPVVASDGLTLYLVGSEGEIIALSSTGEEKWTLFPPEENTRFSANLLLTQEGKLYTLLRDRLLAISSGGQILWEFKPEGGLSGGPVLSPEGLLLVYGNGVLYGVDQGGQKKWSFNLGPNVTPSALIAPAPGIFYVLVGRTAGGKNLLSAYGPVDTSGPRWSPLGLTSLRVFALAVHPQKTNVLYAGTDQGLYRSEDGGKNWSDTGLRAVRGEVPNVPEVVVAQEDSVYAIASNLFSLTHDGVNWSLTQKIENFHLLAVDPKDPNHVVVASSTDTTFLDTSDGGNFFATTDAPAPLSAIRYLSEGTLVATSPSGTFRRSSGGGWEALSLTDPTYSLAVSQDDKTLYAGGEGAVYKSIDGGRSWTRTSARFIGVVHQVAVIPDNPNWVVAATSVPPYTAGSLDIIGINLYLSLDGGQSWSVFNRGLANVDVHRLLGIPGGTFLLAGDQGVWQVSIRGVQPPPPEEEVLWGDISGDGKINIADATLALRIAVGLVSPTEKQIQAGDVAPKPGTGGRAFGDGMIRINDVVRILRRIVGLEQTWP